MVVVGDGLLPRQPGGGGEMHDCTLPNSRYLLLRGRAQVSASSARLSHHRLAASYSYPSHIITRIRDVSGAFSSHVETRPLLRLFRMFLLYATYGLIQLSGLQSRFDPAVSFWSQIQLNHPTMHLSNGHFEATITTTPPRHTTRATTSGQHLTSNPTIRTV